MSENDQIMSGWHASKATQKEKQNLKQINLSNNTIRIIIMELDLYINFLEIMLDAVPVNLYNNCPIKFQQIMIKEGDCQMCQEFIGLTYRHTTYYNCPYIRLGAKQAGADARAAIKKYRGL